MKIIKVSDEVHKRLQEDKQQFTKTIGYSFRFNDVVKEYQKILIVMKIKDKANREATAEELKNSTIDSWFSIFSARLQDLLTRQNSEQSLIQYNALYYQGKIFATECWKIKEKEYTKRLKKLLIVSDLYKIDNEYKEKVNRIFEVKDE